MISIVLINCLVVVLSVLTHYEFLYRLTVYIPKMKIPHRLRIVVGVVGALFAHAFEIWVFGLVYYLLHHLGYWGQLAGATDGSLMDCSYFSFTVFTTLGFGDIQPLGYLRYLRYLSGIEALTGLVLITWTASFLYYEMQRHWSV